MAGIPGQNQPFSTWGRMCGGENLMASTTSRMGKTTTPRVHHFHISRHLHWMMWLSGKRNHGNKSLFIPLPTPKVHIYDTDGKPTGTRIFHHKCLNNAYQPQSLWVLVDHHPLSLTCQAPWAVDRPLSLVRLHGQWIDPAIPLVRLHGQWIDPSPTRQAPWAVDRPLWLTRQAPWAVDWPLSPTPHQGPWAVDRPLSLTCQAPWAVDRAVSLTRQAPLLIVDHLFTLTRQAPPPVMDHHCTVSMITYKHQT